MLGEALYKNKSIKSLWLMIFLVALSACAPEVFSPAVDSRGRRYNSDDLAKDWRSNSRSSRPMMAYPADNDEEYYAPKYNSPIYVPPANQNPQPRQVPQQHSQQPQKAPTQPVYTGDEDENYNNGYPKYDPDEDNSSYYYQNMNKPLPKPVDDGSGNYNYPIYFD